MDGNAKSAKLVKTVVYLVMKIGTCFVMYAMVPIMLIAFGHRWQVFPKMAGSVKDAEDVQTVTVKHQDQDRVAGGMQTTQYVILVTSKGTRALHVPAVEEPTDTLHNEK